MPVNLEDKVRYTCFYADLCSREDHVRYVLMVMPMWAIWKDHVKLTFANNGSIAIVYNACETAR
jgi:hypothetical protein